jgi:SnoaL-like domain
MGKLIRAAASAVAALVLAIGISTSTAGAQTAGRVSDLERLIAIEDIKYLMARYARFIDNRLYDQFRETLAPDCVFEDLDGPGTGMTRGNKAIVDKIRSIVGERRGNHSITMPEIDITSPTGAKAFWRLNLYSTYDLTYVKLPDLGWRIKTWKLLRQPGPPATPAASAKPDAR